MYRSPSLPSGAAIPAPGVSRELLTRGPPAGSGRAPESNGTAEVTRYLTEDRDRIAQRMNDVVVRRIFGAGLDLQAALADAQTAHAGERRFSGLGVIMDASEEVEEIHTIGCGANATGGNLNDPRCFSFSLHYYPIMFQPHQVSHQFCCE